MSATQTRVHHQTVPIIECGTLAAFLHLLPMRPISALLMPIGRRRVMADVDITLAVQVSAQLVEQQGGPAILTATFLAAVYSTLGDIGSLLVPCEEREQPAHTVQQRAHALRAELLHCLVQALQEHPSVACVQHPARYCIPEQWVWGHFASPGESGIRFQKGHWTRSVLPTEDASSDKPAL